MDYYNSKDFSSMQEEAIRRVHEMQQRSKNIVNGTTGQQHQQGSAQSPEPKPKQSPQNQSKPDNTPLQGLLGSLMGTTGGSNELFSISNIKIDEEKALIAMMIYILYKNGADVKLLLGLGYLLI